MQSRINKKPVIQNRNITQAIRFLVLLMWLTLTTNKVALGVTRVSIAPGGNWNSTNSWVNGDRPDPGDDVIINGILDITSAVTVTNITINSGGGLSFNNNPLHILGDLVNNGLAFTDGTIIFDGVNNNQTITGTAAFNNVTVNKTGTTATITLATDITITQALALTSGRIIIGNNDLTYNGTDAALTGTGWIDTNGTGSLIRTTPATSAGSASNFPVGNTERRNVKFTFQVTSTFTNPTSVRFVSGALLPTVTATNAAVGKWVISAAGGGLGLVEFQNVGTAPNATSVIHTSNSVSAWTQFATTPTNVLGIFSYATTTIPALSASGVHFAIFTPLVALPTEYYSINSSNYNDIAIWSNNASGTPACNCSPSGVANANVRVRHTITTTNPLNIGINNTIDIQTLGVLAFGAITTNNIFELKSSTGGGTMRIFGGTNLPVIVTNTFLTTSTNTTIEFAGSAYNIPAAYPSLPVSLSYQSVMISGTATKSLSANTIINGNLTINANTTLNANNFSIDIKSNWTNSGNFNAGTGTTVKFNGANAQTITNTTTFNNLVIDNLSEVTVIIGGIAVNGTLTLTNGSLNVGNNQLTINSPVAGTPFSYAKCIKLGTGQISRTGATTASSVFFPCGTTTSYNPVTVGNISASGSVGVLLRPETITELAPFLTLQRVKYLWTISVGTAMTANVTFGWDTNDANISLTNNNVKIQRLMTTPASWAQEGGTGLFTAGSTSITATSVSLNIAANNTFGVFSTIPASIPTPTLTAPTTSIVFVPSVVTTPDNITLTWMPIAGATGYRIRKAFPQNLGNSTWVELSDVLTGNGNTTFIDRAITYETTIFYSVQAFGTNVTSAWSNTVGILVANNTITSLSGSSSNVGSQITLSPNPMTDNFMIDVATTSSISKENNISFDLIDITGKTITTATTAQGFPYKMDTNNITKGLYYIKITTKDNVIVKKIVKE